MVLKNLARFFGAAVAFVLILPAAVWAQGGPPIVWQASDNSDRVNTVQFSPDGTVLVAGSSDRLVNVFNAANGMLLESMNSNADKVHPNSIECLAINPLDPSMICTVSSNLERIWNTNTGTDTLLGNPSGNWNVWCAFSPNGHLLATASFNDSIRVWNMTTSPPSLVKVFTTNAIQRTCAFSPDGQWLASGGGDRGVTIRSTSSWDVVAVMTGHANDIYDMQFSPDGTMLATGSYDDTARIWNVGSWTQKAVLAGSGPVYGVAFTPDSSTLAFTDGEGNHLMLANTASGQITRTWDVDDVQCVAFSSKGLLGFGDVSDTTYVANVGASGGGGGIAPSVSISSPANNATYNAPADIPLSATAASSNGVANVQYFDQNDNSLGQSSVSPYKVTWSDVPAGNYSITAVMTDNAGLTATSAAVNVNVGTASGPVKVTVSTPANGSAFLTDTITLTGTASDTASNILVTIDGAQDAFPASTRWSAQITLNPGPNTVTVQAQSASGGLSPTVKLSYKYIVSSTLTVVTNGNGRTSAYRSPLIDGDKYSIAAYPDAGYVFNGWTDANNNLLSDDALYTFTMESNTVLQANFIPNPFIPVDGRYTGLIASSPASAEGSGAIHLMVGPKGGFSASIWFDFTGFAISGQFAGNGAYSRTISRGRNPAFDLSLLLDVSNGTDTVTGTISDGSITSGILANRLIWNSRNNPATPGTYSILINPNTSVPDSPQGYGVARAIINSSGAVIIGGRLADGVPFSESTFLSGTNSFPLFVWDGGQDIASGFISLMSATNAEMSGVVNWFRQPNNRAATFSSGFSSANELTGSIDPTPERVALTAGDTDSNGDNVTISLGGADFASPLTFSGVLRGNRIIPDTSTGSPRGFTLAFNSAGIMEGSFIDPNSGRSAAFLGIVYPDENIAAGYFLQNGQSGYIEVAPTP